MTAFLPPNLLQLFAPKDAIKYLPPVDKLPWEKKRVPITGVSQYTKLFEDPADTPLPTATMETRQERINRKRREKREQLQYKLEQDLALWNPKEPELGIESITADPYKSLFVARLNYATTESKLAREFENYGPIVNICMVKNRENKKTGRPRGYAFVEFENEKDMHAAYKHADGRKIDDRRIIVDVERGRTIKGWRPRRLGGGAGPGRRRKKKGESDRNGADDRGPGGDRGFRRSRSRSRGRDDRRRVERSDRHRSRSRDRDRRDRDRRDDRRRRSRSPRRSRSRDRRRRRERSGSRSPLPHPSSSNGSYGGPKHESGVKSEKITKLEPSANGDEISRYNDY